MMVQVFEGMSMREVMRRIKKEVGKNAVILSTKEKDIDGSKSKAIEVKVAVPEEKRTGASRNESPEPTITMDELSPILSLLERKIDHISENLASKDRLTKIEGSLKELNILVSGMISKKFDSSIGRVPDAFKDLIHKLLLTGVDNSHVLDLIKHLNSLPAFDEEASRKYQTSNEYYRAYAIRYFLKNVKVAPSFLPADNSRMVHCFLGATGSGKTSVIAKAAANIKKSSTKEILLLSFENPNVLTHDSLRLFAKILGISFYNVESGKECQKILASHPEAELVFIDTVGALPKNESDLKGLKDLANHVNTDFHLLLSLTEKSVQLDRTIQAFAPLGLRSLLFSKLDESWAHGDMYNLVAKWSLPLSYFSTGQKIPDDFERASKERVIERIFAL